MSDVSMLVRVWGVCVCVGGGLCTCSCRWGCFLGHRLEPILILILMHLLLSPGEAEGTKTLAVDHKGMSEHSKLHCTFHGTSFPFKHTIKAYTHTHTHTHTLTYTRICTDAQRYRNGTQTCPAHIHWFGLCVKYPLCVSSQVCLRCR